MRPTVTSAQPPVPAAPTPLAIVVAGVSSSGKSTVGAAVAERLGVRFLDADDFHPPANVAKMAGGVPLTDDDRWPWLDRLNQELREAVQRGDTIVLACSALRVVYRERLAAGIPGFRLALLDGEPTLLAARAAARSHRYMPPSLLASQLATLEPLAAGGGRRFDVALPVADLVDAIVRWSTSPEASAGA